MTTSNFRPFSWNKQEKSKSANNETMETRDENFKKCGTFPFELLREVNKFGHPLVSY